MRRKVPFLKLASQKEINKIHEASLQVLKKTGIRIAHKEALKKLKEVGANVDHKSQTVRFSPKLVEEALRKVPKKIKLAARDPEKDVTLERDTIYARPTGGPDHLIDLRTDKYREIVVADVVEWAILVDALKNMSYVLGIYPNDVPLATRDVRVAKIMLENTTKHVQLQPYSGESMKCIAQMAEIIAGGAEQLRKRPPVSVFVSCLTPLQFGYDDVEILKVCGEYRIPVMLNSSPIAGATGPVTLTGSLVLLNAEIIAGNVMMQALNPESPIVYAIRPAVFDMRTMITAHGYGESTLAAAVGIQLAREKYNLYTDVHGPRTDSKVLDEQAGLEKAFVTPVVCLAGANIVAGAGMLESDGAVSPVQLVIDNELIEMTFRNLQGLEVNDENLAVSLIDRVGPGGHFLDNEHTLRHYKQEFYRSAILNRESRQMWRKKGAKTAKEEARDKALEIIERHKPAPLGKLLREELEKIVSTVEDKAKNVA